LGWLAVFGIGTLNLDALFYLPHWELVVIAVGAVIGLSRARMLLWIVNAILFAGYLAIGFSPLAKVLWRDLQERDSLVPADAVVVLASAYLNDSTLSAHSQDRLLHGLKLLHAGYAGRLVLTGGETDVWPVLARREMEHLGLNYPIDEAGRVHDTHTEALAVSRLVREKGWSRVILVTHTWHMCRAAALFRKAGVQVACSSCSDSVDDFESLDDAGARLRVWGIWLHERIGYWVSKRKSWI